MHIQKYLLRFTVIVVTFFIGCSAYTGYRFCTQLLLPADHGRKIIAASNAVKPASMVRDDWHDSLNTYYCIFDATLTNGFQDFDYLTIRTVSTDGRPIPPVGSVKAKRIYNFKTVTISTSGLMFETETIRRTSFSFSGKFDPASAPAEIGDTATTIRGYLMKLENSREVARMNVTFFPVAPNN